MWQGTVKRVRWRFDGNNVFFLKIQNTNGYGKVAKLSPVGRLAKLDHLWTVSNELTKVGEESIPAHC